MLEHEGLKLTQQAINELKLLQQDKNDRIRNYNEVLADISCETLFKTDGADESLQPEVLEYLREISFLRRTLRRLQTP